MPKHYLRILITRGAGFIGSHIVDRFLKEGIDVTVIDDLSSGHLENTAHNQGKKEIKVSKVAQALKDSLSKRDIKNVYADPRLGEFMRGYVDISKAKRMLNYAPRFSFEHGIADLVKWYVRG